VHVLAVTACLGVGFVLVNVLFLKLALIVVLMNQASVWLGLGVHFFGRTQLRFCF